MNEGLNIHTVYQDSLAMGAYFSRSITSYNRAILVILMTFKYTKSTCNHVLCVGLITRPEQSYRRFV
jgi:hypothetical protein